MCIHAHSSGLAFQPVAQGSWGEQAFYFRAALAFLTPQFYYTLKKSGNPPPPPPPATGLSLPTPSAPPGALPASSQLLASLPLASIPPTTEALALALAHQLNPPPTTSPLPTSLPPSSQPDVAASPLSPPPASPRSGSQSGASWQDPSFQRYLSEARYAKALKAWQNFPVESAVDAGKTAAAQMPGSTGPASVSIAASIASGGFGLAPLGASGAPGALPAGPGVPRALTGTPPPGAQAAAAGVPAGAAVAVLPAAARPPEDEHIAEVIGQLTARPESSATPGPDGIVATGKSDAPPSASTPHPQASFARNNSASASISNLLKGLEPRGPDGLAAVGSSAGPSLGQLVGT